MNTLEKTTLCVYFNLLQTSTNWRFFSSEGNLRSPKCIHTFYQSLHSMHKPRGLWYSFGPAWIEWLTNDYKELGKGYSWENNRVGGYSNIYVLSLNQKNVCCIHNLKAFDKFNKKYGTKNNQGIYWEKVERDYAGIEIKFMQQRCSGWYDSWDCSSGCIWNKKAVRRIRCIKSWEMEWKNVS